MTEIRSPCVSPDKVEVDKVVVLVVGVGLRKQGDKGDIYTLIEKLLEE